MNMQLMTIQDMTADQVHYAIAKHREHHWRYPWLLMDEGYKQWRGAELAGGNWHSGEEGITLGEVELSPVDRLWNYGGVWHADGGGYSASDKDLTLAFSKCLLKSMAGGDTCPMPADAKWN